MEFELLNDSNKDEWNAFCLTSENAWFRHTTFWMDYIQCCRFDSNSRNHSFLVRQNNEIVAIVPLISQYIYEDKLFNEFANYDTPTPYFALKNDEKNINRHDLIKKIHEKISSIAEQDKIQQIRFFIDPLIDSNYNNTFENFNLLKYEYELGCKTTNIIDLTKDQETLLREMRKGHKADIKVALRNIDLNIQFYDKATITTDAINIFKEIHRMDAGRQTRTDSSWKCMHDWVVQGHAVLLLVWSTELQKYITGTFIILFKRKAYYGSYATLDSNYAGGIIGHLVQWNVILYLKQNGYSQYETGWNYYKTYANGECFDTKILQISKFKNGFGGNERLLLCFFKKL